MCVSLLCWQGGVRRSGKRGSRVEDTALPAQGPRSPAGPPGNEPVRCRQGGAQPRFLPSPLAGQWLGEAPVPTEVAAAPHSPFGCVHLITEVAAAQPSLAVYVRFLSRQSRAAPHAPRGRLCEVPVTTEPGSPTRALQALSPVTERAPLSRGGPASLSRCAG